PMARTLFPTLPNSQGGFVEALVAFGIVGPVLLLLILWDWLRKSVIGFFARKSALVSDLDRFSLLIIALSLAAFSFVVESYILEANRVLIALLIIINFEATTHIGGRTVGRVE